VGAERSGFAEAPMADVVPEGFVWGVATSAFQIEGAHDVDGRGPSIWDTFAAQPGAIADGSNARVACDHYHRFEQDIQIIRSLGVRAYRFSVSWPRILPTGRGAVNAAGLDFYERLVDALLAAGIDPWLTLYHWDLPQALEDGGGWVSRSTVDAFVEFANSVSRRLGDRVTHWITHNEPWCASVLGYAQGEHAPGKKSWPDALVAAHHILLSHGRAVPVLRSNVRGARVGITINTSPCVPASPSRADRDAARQFDGELHRWFLDPLYFGSYPQDVVDAHARAGRLPHGLHFVQPGDLEAIAAPTDFLGINYYTRAVVRSDGISEAQNEPRTIPTPAPEELTDMGWEVYPEGLTQSLVRLHADYRPAALVITENGAADATGPGPDGSVDDTRRCDYLKRHVRACLDALEAGVPLEGYFLWSLLDNFEWAFGCSKRFGIVWVDFETQARIVKASAHVYSRLLRQGGFAKEQAA
jgi:beta-glucosidase